ncbi:nucleotidyltransferase family protein [Sporomusa malonica]|uniref:Molybdenum cofactor cytidylyltransferase n=1 Tax=Sporomusa malonica TaxID=112901 RepID=A0A1W1YH76_9FIRM|nr:nucleotidyltransferase family protein [Sporomusa malonica]SMC35580.1 molybdenum cofactor cytidylyltransferase [Sporomusa malonica]
MKARIAAVILAAGTASRMGQQKLLLPLGGKPLLAHVLSTVHEMPWADCVAIIGEPQAELTELCQQYHIRSVFNAKRQSGQASSVTLALTMLQKQLDGIVFFLGDQPLVSQELVQALLSKFEQVGCNQSIIVPCCQGQRYNPVLFGSHWRVGLAGITGDMGGRQVVRENPEWVSELDWPHPELFYDADTWQDYQKLRKLSEE